MDNFKVKCVSTVEGEGFTKGKVYKIENRYITDDTGFSYDTIANVEDLNCDFIPQFKLAEGGE